MCGPIVAAAVGGGAAGLNIIQGRQQARAQNKFNLRNYGVNKTEALRSMVAEIADTQVRVSEERLSTSQALLQLTREAQETVGTVVASDTTVEGASVDALLDDYKRQELIRIGVAETQLKSTENQAERNKEAIRANARTRINLGFGQPAAVPNLLNAAVQIGTSAFDNYLAAGGANPTTTGSKK